MPSVQTLSAWVTKTNQRVVLGHFKNPREVLRVRIEVSTAFNGSGTDEIRVGTDDDNDAYATLTDVASTGIKTPTLGTGVGFDKTERNVVAEYVNGGGEPTTGSALVTVEFCNSPPQVT